MNIELANRVFHQIDAHPDLWKQSDWALQTPCGTAHCFAGWAVVLSGFEIQWCTMCPAEGEPAHADECMHPETGEAGSINDVAENLLGLTMTEGNLLFDGGNTRAELGLLVAQIQARQGVPA